MSARKAQGTPLVINYHPGGTCGPPGSVSHESFHRRRRITLHVLVEEDSLPSYAESEDHCIELGKELGSVLHHYIKEDASGRGRDD